MSHCATAQDLFEDLSTSETESDDFDLNLPFACEATNAECDALGCEGKQLPNDDIELRKLVEFYVSSQCSPKVCLQTASLLSTRGFESLPPPEKFVRKNRRIA